MGFQPSTHLSDASPFKRDMIFTLDMEKKRKIGATKGNRSQIHKSREKCRKIQIFLDCWQNKLHTSEIILMLLLKSSLTPMEFGNVLVKGRDHMALIHIHNFI